MSLFDRAQAIKQQQNAAALAQQDAAIDKAKAFWDRVDGIKQLNAQRNGAYAEFMANTGYNPDVPFPFTLSPGNDPNNDVPTIAPSKPRSPSAPAVAADPVSPATFDYLNADLAKYYGMSKNTAYQEALENTSYQRAMKDMKAAGLNPAVMFGSGRANGAGSSVYPSSASSGGGYSRRSGGKSSGNGKLFSSSAYGAIAAIGGLIGIATTKKPDGFWIGSSTAQGAMNLLNAVHENK